MTNLKNKTLSIFAIFLMITMIAPLTILSTTTAHTPESGPFHRSHMYLLLPHQ